MRNVTFVLLLVSLFAPGSHAAETRPVYVGIFDDSGSNPVRGIGVRVKGKKWARLACKYGGCQDAALAPGTGPGRLFLGEGAVGSTLVVEIDDGEVTHSVSVKLTADLCPNDCVRDMLQLRFTEDAVRLSGGQLKAAGGKTFEILFTRGKATPGRWFK